MQLRSEVAAAQNLATRAKADAEAAAARAVDARLRAQTTESDRQLTALTRRLDGLSTSVTELTTRIEELATRVDTLGRQLKGASAAPTPTPAPPGPAAPRTATPVVPPAAPGAVPAPPPPAGARPSTNALTPQDIYQAAYIDFSKGSYALAMAGFREFLRRFPEHALAGNAQYWIGESHFSLARGHVNAGAGDKAMQELEQAVQEFRKVLANYPRGEKAPTALYKEALALLELKQPALAQQRLEYLVANFPQAEETPLARERLVAIKAR